MLKSIPRYFRYHNCNVFAELLCNYFVIFIARALMRHHTVSRVFTHARRKQGRAKQEHGWVSKQEHGWVSKQEHGWVSKQEHGWVS